MRSLYSKDQALSLAEVLNAVDTKTFDVLMVTAFEEWPPTARRNPDPTLLADGFRAPPDRFLQTIVASSLSERVTFYGRNEVASFPLTEDAARNLYQFAAKLKIQPGKTWPLQSYPSTPLAFSSLFQV